MNTIHFITHNFGDWDSDTKHMTRNQRAIYLDLRTLYFSTAQKSSGSLTMDFDLLCFKMGCRTDSDCTDLKWLLKDKFKIINKKYRHATWDEQIKNIRFAMEKSCNAGNVASNGGNAQNNTSNAPCNAKSNAGNVASNAKIYNNTGGYVMTSTERSEKSRKLKALINQGLDVDKIWHLMKLEVYTTVILTPHATRKITANATMNATHHATQATLKSRRILITIIITIIIKVVLCITAKRYKISQAIHTTRQLGLIKINPSANGNHPALIC